jgi:predicted enzyme related to lactoylglutathione lyase
MNDDWPADMPPHWMNYFAVDDCDKAAEKTTELGGTVHQAPFDSPYGRIAVISDPWGATLSLMQLADNPPR